MNRRTAALLVGGLLLLTACVEDTGPDAEACAAPTAQIDLTLSVDSLDPNDPSVCRDQDITLTVSSTVDGVFHIHGYDEAVPAAQVVAGEQVTLEFTATRSGQFPIEVHAADDPEGVEVGVFTVHEP